MASQNVPGVATLQRARLRATGVADHRLDRRGDGRCWRRSAAMPSTWRRSPRRSAWVGRRTRSGAALHGGRGGGRASICSSGCSAATVAAVFAAFPRELVLAIAGLALLGTIGNGLAAALKDEATREAALITFLMTASGVTLWSIGSAFWGLVAGLLALAVRSWRRRGAVQSPPPPPQPPPPRRCCRRHPRIRCRCSRRRIHHRSRYGWRSSSPCCRPPRAQCSSVRSGSRLRWRAGHRWQRAAEPPWRRSGSTPARRQASRHVRLMPSLAIVRDCIASVGV